MEYANWHHVTEDEEKDSVFFFFFPAVDICNADYFFPECISGEDGTATNLMMLQTLQNIDAVDSTVKLG